MTLIAAWIRRTPGGKELIVASDSRLTGGITSNHAPKIFRLERNDAVLAYCGSTLVAYPLILQIKAGLDAYEETRNRVIDIVQLKTHIEKIIERLRTSMSYPLKDDSSTSFKILLAGYSWRVNDFRVWQFRFDVKTGEFNAFKMCGKHSFQFMSDMQENEIRATDYVMKKIRHPPKGEAVKLSWEPLEALVDVIQDKTIKDIGGPPQLVKVYRHSNTMPVNVLWPEEVKLWPEEVKFWPKEKLWPEEVKGSKYRINTYRITHLGRPLLDYEHSRYLTLDPETWKLIEPWKVSELIASRNLRELEAAKKKQIYSICVLLELLAKRKQLQGELNAMISMGCNFDELRAAMNRVYGGNAYAMG